MRVVKRSGASASADLVRQAFGWTLRVVGAPKVASTPTPETLALLRNKLDPTRSYLWTMTIRRPRSYPANRRAEDAPVSC